LRSIARDEWVSCPLDEITWLDRSTLSANEDVTLHRAPRCAGLRHVHHQWELFSRDTTYQVYLAPDADGAAPSAEVVQRTARYVLPVAPASYEARPVVLEEGRWLVSVAAWVLRLRLEMPAVSDADPDEPDDDREAATQAGELVRMSGASGRAAVAGVRAYFERNAMARLAMAYYYQEFILGRPAPQNVPMMNVVIALNLSGEGAVSDYKKLLQGIIWSERGHARDLAGFLLVNGLLTPADLDEARRVAAENERNGVCEIARQRLRYHPRSRQLPGLKTEGLCLLGHARRACVVAWLLAAGPGPPWPRRALARPRRALDAGPALFGVPDTLTGAPYCCTATASPPRVPAHRAAGRDEAAGVAWRYQTWARRWRRRPGRGSASRTRPGMRCTRRRPVPGAGTAPPGGAPLGEGPGRVPVAGLVWLKPAEPARFCYRMRLRRGTARHALAGALPAYAPDLSPVEGTRSSMNSGLGNLTARGRRRSRSSRCRRAGWPAWRR
jgi:hypothetical protein